MVHWTPAEPHFSQLSVIMLDKDRNRPEKPCHVTGYVQIYYEIVVDFFVLDKCFKFTFCSKIVRSCQNLKKLIQTPKVSLKLPSQQSGQALSPLTEVAGAAAVWILFYPIFLRSEREGVGQQIISCGLMLSSFKRVPPGPPREDFLLLEAVRTRAPITNSGLIVT